MMLTFESITHAGIFGLPLDVFCGIGGFMEEIVAVLPSPLVMGSAGAAAFEQHRNVLELASYAGWGALGKTLGALLLYGTAHQLEGFTMRRFGRIWGISHDQIVKAGNYFTRSWKDFFLILMLRMLPVIPSTVLSVACGILKTDLRDFITATLAGSVLRNFLYLYLGYEGIMLYQSASHHDAGVTAAQIQGGIAVLFLTGTACYFLWNKWRKRGI